MMSAGLIGVGAWELDLASLTLLWSPETCIIHGVPPDFQPTSETAAAFFAPEAQALLGAAMTQAVADGRSWDLELALTRADGRRIWVRSVGIAVIEDGTPVRLSGLLQDVSAQVAERQALREANERSRLAIEAGGIGIWDWDIVADRMVWDARMYALYGRCPSQRAETVEIWRSCLHPDDRARAEQALQDSLSGVATFETYFRIVWSDGSIHHIRGAGLVTRDEAGRPLRMVGSNWDVTAKTLIITERIERDREKIATGAELERAEERAREAADRAASVQREKERFRAAIQAVQGVLWTNDATGRMEGEQVGWAALTGQDLHEYQGHGWASAVHPDDAQPTMEAWNHAVAGRRTFEFEHRVRRFDGCWRTFAIRAVPLLDAHDGGIREWVGVHTDITEQRQAEANLLEANAELDRVADEFRTLGESMAELCWMAEPDGHIYWYNRRWYDYTGTSADEMAGWGWQSVHDPQALPDVLETWQASIAAGTVFEMTFPLRGADGVFRPFLTRIVPLHDTDGRVKRWLGTNVDVSGLTDENSALEERVKARTADLEQLTIHLEQARDAAQQASDAKSRFLSGMSHELRTPLNGILGYAKLLQLEGGLAPTQAMRVSAMLEAGKHLLHMINRVLDLSEIEAGHITLQATTFDVRDMAEACLDVIRPQSEATGLALSVVMAPGTQRELFADETRLRQVLLNLLGNAVKFTSYGAVALRLRPCDDGAGIRIEVADTGPGVSAEQRGRLFQEFERLDTKATRAAEGSGLGLFLSARLAGLMGGRLGYEDNPGGGSVFWLELPLNIPTISAAPAAGMPDTRPAWSMGSKLRVLVVDDVLMNRDIAGSFLRGAGHEVTCAEGGAEAVAAVAGADFDVVLMDVRMPEMDGLEATRRIRALEGERGQVPIVALTAQAFPEQVGAYQAAGMNDVLGKPFEMDALLMAVERAAARGPHHHARLSATPIDLSAAASVDTELPVLDPSAFERTTVHLAPKMVDAHLRTIAELGETLLRALHEPGALIESGDPLIDLVHKLVGTSGMFGYERLAAAGRAYERATLAEAVDLPVLADRLGAAADATCQEIYARTHCSL